MQERGKGSASASGQDPALTADEADELAASFRPAWADDGEPTDLDVHPPTVVVAPEVLAEAVPAAAPAPVSTTAPAVVPAPVISVGAETATNRADAKRTKTPATTVIGGMTAPVSSTPKPASPDATQIMATRPSRPGSKKSDKDKKEKVEKTAPLAESLPQSMKATQPSAKRSAPPPPKSKPPRSVAVATDPFRPPPGEATEELKALVVHKGSSKNTLFVVVGVAIAAGLIVFLKFALSDDPPKTKPTVSEPVGIRPPSTANDIPPPPAKEELPPAKAEAKAETKAEPKPEPPKTEPPKTEPPKAEAPPTTPAPHIEPKPAETRSEARTEAKPVKPPAVPSSPGAPPAAGGAPKTPPKGPGGGIVRDNPF